MSPAPPRERCVSCDICTKGTSFAGIHCRCGADLTHATHVWLDANGAPIRHSGVPDAPPEQARATGKRWTLHVCGVCYEAKPEPFRDHSHLGIKWEDQWTAFVPAADLDAERERANAAVLANLRLIGARPAREVFDQMAKQVTCPEHGDWMNQTYACCGKCYERATQKLAQAEKEIGEYRLGATQALSAAKAAQDRAEQAGQRLAEAVKEAINAHAAPRNHYLPGSMERCCPKTAAEHDRAEIARLDREKGKP